MSADPVEDADCYGDKLEKEEEEYYEQLDFQRNNWLDAVTKSPTQSFGSFYGKSSTKIFLDTLCNKDFEQRVAKLLINEYTLGVVNITEVCTLFHDMATDYAESKV